MNLKMMLLLVFLNMILHCCAVQFFKDYFIIITNIDKNILRRGTLILLFTQMYTTYNIICSSSLMFRFRLFEDEVEFKNNLNGISINFPIILKCL